MTMTNAAKMRVVLFASLLFVMSVQCAASQPQNLELSLDREVIFYGAHDICGALTCKAKGNSVTIDTVTVTEVGAAGGSTHLLTVTAAKPDANISTHDIRGNGTITTNNRAKMYFDLLKPSNCGSRYFICEVVFTKISGKRERQFATAGPGQAADDQTDSHSGQFGPEPQHPWYRPASSCASELCSMKDQINEVKFESLERRMNQMFDIINSVDFSSRVSRLEDKFSSLLLPQSPNPEQNTTETLDDLERRLAEIEASNESPQTGNENSAIGPNTTKALEDLERRVAELEASKETSQTEDEPQVCERGMGDNSTYVVLTQATIQKQILCDATTDGGGWIVIQRRANGDGGFNRNWTEYRDGFGSFSTDFWLGNEAIHNLTNEHPYELRIDLRVDSQETFARYASFKLENEADKYRLRLGSYSGTSGSRLDYHNNIPFSTYDRDNDSHQTVNCAAINYGGWWYRACQYSNLNGRARTGFSWNNGSGRVYPSFTEMKIRRVQSNASG